MTMSTRAIFPTLDRMMTLDRELDRVFGRALIGNGSASPFTPALDVVETESAYIVSAELPGIDPATVDLTFERNMLTLKGTKPAHVAEKEQRMHLHERTAGDFERSLRLPGLVDAEKISATHAHGVLTVTVPKAAQALPRKISIQG
jgi:HSP20 family protein